MYTNTNRFLRVTDNTGYSSYYSEDMDHQAATINYAYDNTGNLTVDAAEKITNISWTVYGKIASIVKNGATISYSYDAAGNRITKTAGGITTLYVRDASGNVMSVYELPAAEQLVQKELHLYGSSRIGIVKVDNEVVERTPLPGGGEMVIRKFTRGNKFFETTNQLGNVLATVTDRKLLQSSTEQAGINNGGCQPGTAVEELTVMQRGTASQFTARTAVYLEAGFETVDAVDELEVNTSTQQGSCVVLPPATISNGQAWYVADVVSATDYAPFGMALVGRSYSSEKYRYGFNGQEKSTEIDGNGNNMTAEFWQYDARLGRRWNVDPRPNTSTSPYSGFADNPLIFSDVKGDTAVPREPLGFANNYQKREEVKLSYNANHRVYNIVDNTGGRYLIKESSELVNGHNGSKDWKTSRSYFSERPQEKGTEYAADAKWVPYKDAGEIAKEQSADASNVILGALGISALSIFAAPIIAEGVPLISKAVASELSLVKYIPKSWKAYAGVFSANLGLQFALNGKDADIYDAAAATANPFFGLFTNPIINYKPFAGDVAPTVGADRPSTMIKNFLIGAPFTVLGASVNSIQPSFNLDYFLNATESVINQSIKDPK